jgi:hypothetical protein
MQVELVERSNVETDVPADEILFQTLPELGLETMTPGGVEFILCASALTAQV